MWSRLLVQLYSWIEVKMKWRWISLWKTDRYMGWVVFCLWSSSGSCLWCLYEINAFWSILCRKLRFDSLSDPHCTSYSSPESDRCSQLNKFGSVGALDVDLGRFRASHCYQKNRKWQADGRTSLLKGNTSISSSALRRSRPDVMDGWIKSNRSGSVFQELLLQ